MTYGAQARVQSPQKDLTQGSNGANGELDSFLKVVDNAFLINSNDGDNNFDTGLSSNRASVLMEADLKWNNFGFFARGKAWIDTVYANQSTDSEDYGSNNANPAFGPNGGHNANQYEHIDSTEEYNGGSARFLDAFAYGNFDMGDRSLNLRIGRQVISWGEALLSGGGISSAINPVDAQIMNVPGIEIKEMFLPNGAVYAQFDLTQNLIVETYYQYEWQATFVNPVGSMFSQFDSIGYGGETFMLLTGEETRMFGIDLTDQDFQPYIPTAGDTVSNTILVPHLKEKAYARDDGQFGIAGHYLFDNGAELGLYYVRYHDKTPSWILPLDAFDEWAPVIETVVNGGTVEGEAGFLPFKGVQDLSSELGKDAILMLLNGFTIQPDAMDYTIKYFEDIRLYGLSYSTVIGTSSIGAELTYRPNAPVMTATVNRLPARDQIMHAHLNALHVFGPSYFYDSAVLTAEAVAWHIPGGRNSNDTHDPSRLAVQNTAQGWGYSFLWSFEHKNVMQGVNLSVPIYVNHGVNGAMFNSGYRKKQVTFSIGLTAKYLTSVEAGLSYVTYFGSKEDVFQRLLSDRDHISFNIKYGF